MGARTYNVIPMTSKVTTTTIIIIIVIIIAKAATTITTKHHHYNNNNNNNNNKGGYLRVGAEHRTPAKYYNNRDGKGQGIP